MPYRVDYWLHGTQGTFEAATLDEALAFAGANEADGSLSADRIVDPTGAVLLDGPELKDAIATWIETWP
jgi:hypothetical protein